MIMKPIGDVFLDRQDKVREELRQDSEYMKLENVINKAAEGIIGSGQAVLELFSRYDNAILNQNAITENAMYMAGLRDGIEINNLWGEKQDD